MNGIEERKKRCTALKQNMDKLKIYGDVRKESLPAMITARGFSVSRSTIFTVSRGSYISEEYLDGIEPIIETIMKEMRIIHARCNGQIKIDGSVR